MCRPVGHSMMAPRDVSIRHNFLQPEEDARAVAPWYKNLTLARAGSITWFLTRLHTSDVFTAALELFVL